MAAAASHKLSGKVALVFGGTSGIGLATCIRLRDCGVSVTAVGRSGKFSAEGANVEGIAIKSCDVQDRTALGSLFEGSGPVDILVSSATGGDRAVGPFLSMDLDGFQGSFAKLWGYANVVSIGAPYVKEQGGSITLVSGTPARRPKPGQVALSCVGASVEQLTRTVAPELAAKGVRINTVSPGVIATPMFGEDDDARAAKLDGMVAGSLVGRPGLPDEVAQGIMFVVENDFVTGTTVDVDGGHLWKY